MGDAFLRLDLALGVGVGDGVGEIFLCLGEAVGDELGVAFFAECFRCLRGAGVALVKIFLIFVPSKSSAAFAAWNVPNEIATIRNHFMSMLVFKQTSAWSKIQIRISRLETNKRVGAALPCGWQRRNSAPTQRGDYSKQAVFRPGLTCGTAQCASS